MFFFQKLPKNEMRFLHLSFLYVMTEFNYVWNRYALMIKTVFIDSGANFVHFLSNILSDNSNKSDHNQTAGIIYSVSQI